MPSFRTTAGEDAAINLYCKQLGDVVEIKRLDPPDAVIERNKGVFEWMEISSVWLGEHRKEHKSYAKALNNSNSHGEVFYHSYPTGYWKTLEPDLIHAIKKKDGNLTYQPFLEKYGKGVLILNLEDPYYGIEELIQICLSIGSDYAQLIHFRSIFLHLNGVHELHGGVLRSCPSRLIPVILK